MARADAGRRSVPAAVIWILALGFALSIAQQLAVLDEVFVSGDGGIKTLVAKQFARSEWHADLRLPAAPWVDELWRAGFYPFGPPFAYERDAHWFVQYPLPFMVVTAPFYDLFGFRGLTIVPLIGLWLLWLSMVPISRRFGLSRAGSAVSIGGLIFCSFVTPYGAMYWEHTLALGLSFLGFAVVLERSSGSGSAMVSFAGGALLGLAVWFRPESAAFAVGVCLVPVALRRDVRASLVAAAGFGSSCLMFAGLNLWLYESPLGVHAVQRIDPLTEHVAHFPAHEIALYFIDQLAQYCPVIGVLIVSVLARLRPAASRVDGSQAMLWAIVAIFCVGTVLMVPNDGGTQLGARYFLHALPPLFLLLGFAWDDAADLGRRSRQVLRGLIAIGLVVGVHLNAVGGTRAIFLDYQYRALPALQALRSDPNRVVVVEHQWMAQDLESLFEEKVFFRVRSHTELEQLSKEMLERDRTEFTLVRYEETQPSVIEASGVRLHMQPLGRFGVYGLVHCKVESGRPSAR